MRRAHHWLSEAQGAIPRSVRMAHPTVEYVQALRLGRVGRQPAWRDAFGCHRSPLRQMKNPEPGQGFRISSSDEG
ncbi:hypothetical protein D3C79_1082800 [compost metagenome]